MSVTAQAPLVQAAPLDARLPRPASCLYEGWVRHRRVADVDHEFRYRMSMVYLDLAELPRALDHAPLASARHRALARFHPADHLGGRGDGLDERVRALVADRTGSRPDGPVRVLTTLRALGILFNPVSFFFCFDDSERLQALVAEVTNTPWGERHCYVLGGESAPADGVLAGGSDKVFHVSPFQGMDHRYQWRVRAPSQRLDVHIESHREGSLAFDATLAMRRRPLTRGALARSLARQPVMPLRVLGGIYAQAVRLKLKGAPVFPHPEREASR